MKTPFITTRVMFTLPPKPTKLFMELQNRKISRVGGVCVVRVIFLFVCILFFWGSGFVWGLFIVYL